MVIAIWLSTAFLQIPCHNRLASGFDEQAYRMLVTTKWLRTILCTARGMKRIELECTRNNDGNSHNLRYGEMRER